MGPESVSLWLIGLGILAVVDSIIGGKYLFKVKQFLRRMVLSIAIFTIAIVAKSNTEVANYIYNSLFYVLLIIITIVITIVLYDMAKVVMKSDELYSRRHRKGGSRRPTPARH